MALLEQFQRLWNGGNDKTGLNYMNENTGTILFRELSKEYDGTAAWSREIRRNLWNGSVAGMSRRNPWNAGVRLNKE